MTALKPIENRSVRAVASERYPLNFKCAHPECTEYAVDPHHAFPRSTIGGDSWFVEIIGACERDTDGDGDCPVCARGGNTCRTLTVIPHVTGLCRAHHDDVEEHRAWIRLNDDGFWEWWDRYHGKEPTETDWIDPATGTGWTLLGELNPQPGSVEGKPKRRKRATTSEERKARVNYTVKTPKDEENVIPELVDAAREALHEEMGWDDDVPAYFVITAALSALLQSRTSGRRRK